MPLAALSIGCVSASVFIGHPPFSIWPGLVHLKCSFSFFQRMNFDGQSITDPGSTRMHGATLITPRLCDWTATSRVVSGSPRPIRRRSSARTRSETALTTSAPSGGEVHYKRTNLVLTRQACIIRAKNAPAAKRSDIFICKSPLYLETILYVRLSGLRITWLI